MRDWNVVVTTEPDGFDEAAVLLAPLGLVDHTRFYNVLTMRVDDVDGVLAAVDRRGEEEPRLHRVVSRVLPAQRAFDVGSVEDLRERTTAVARDLAPRLAGGSFHVRVHLRGQPGASTRDEEERVAAAVFDRLDETGDTAEVTFDDPDAVVDVETVDDRVGVSLWTRADLDRHPLLQVD